MHRYLNTRSQGMVSSSFAAPQSLSDKRYCGLPMPYQTFSEIESRRFPEVPYRPSQRSSDAIGGTSLPALQPTTNSHYSVAQLIEGNMINAPEGFHQNDSSYMQYAMPGQSITGNNVTLTAMENTWLPSAYECLPRYTGVQDNNRISIEFRDNVNNFTELEKMTQNLEELIKETDASHFQHEAPSLHTSNSSTLITDTSPPSSTASSKRMRWTPELHDRFIEAVNLLGGADKSTPKGILTLMKIDGLTIYQVKSHLQKFRTARYKPESSEGFSEGKNLSVELPLLDSPKGIDITEALKHQMELQKMLYEQLENQRKLQLRIEEQGKCLKSMIEKQEKEFGKLKASSSLEESSLESFTEFINAGKNLENEIIGLKDCISDSLSLERPLGVITEKRKMTENVEAAVPCDPAEVGHQFKRLKDSNTADVPLQ